MVAALNLRGLSNCRAFYINEPLNISDPLNINTPLDIDEPLYTKCLPVFENQVN